MKLETFFDNFALLTDAPNAVTKLREIVLQLAVRGKLIYQNPNDVRTKKFQVNSNGSENKFFECQFPSGWILEYLGSITDIMSGNAFKSTDFQNKNGVKAIKITNVGVQEFVETEECLPSDFLGKYPQYIVNSGDILIALTRPYISQGLKVCICPENYDSSLLNQRVAALRRLAADLSIDYLYLYLRCDLVLEFVKEASRTMNQPNLSIKDLKNLPIPIPPVEEQKRIVEKCDRLLILCDEIEKRQQQRQSSLLKMNEGAISQLLTAQSPDDFQHHWQGICNNFDLLYSTPETIPKLRQAILQLAVQGKLVPQDPNDESTDVLLEKIITERKLLLSEAKIKKLKPVKVLSKDEGFFNIPSTWRTAYLQDLIDPRYSISYGVLVPGLDVAGGVPFVRIQDLDALNPQAKPNKSIDPEIEAKYLRTRLRGGEILLGVVGSIGKIGIAPKTWAGANIARAVCRISPVSSVSKEYLLLVLQSPKVQEYFIGSTRTLAQPTLNVALVEKTKIPLPPLAEQKRIVTKVDSLLSLCDTLEAKLKAARDSSTTLMEVAARQVLTV